MRDPAHLTAVDLEQEIRLCSAFIEELRAEIGRVVVGQGELIEALLIALLTGGHLLIEGVPGLAKTLVAKTFARSLGLSWQRIQFTPDLLPSDLTGTPVYHPGTGEFHTRKGPVFTQLLLADEINRAPAKVQSALLEAMEERQVTLGEETHPLPAPFLVLATQNPIEHEGTYPLPEAQTDRFMLKAVVGYPSRGEEERILDLQGGEEPPGVSPVVSATAVTEGRKWVGRLHLDPRIRSFLLDMVEATRAPERFGLPELAPLLEHGASPRGSIYLMRAARARAFLQHRAYVVPDDVVAMAPAVLRHRLRLSYEAEARGIGAEEILRRVLERISVP